MNSSFQIYLTLLFMTNPIVAQTKVIDLITPETKAWKSSSISQYFNVVAANKILQVPMFKYV